MSVLISAVGIAAFVLVPLFFAVTWIKKWVPNIIGTLLGISASFAVAAFLGLAPTMHTRFAAVVLAGMSLLLFGLTNRYPTPERLRR